MDEPEFIAQTGEARTRAEREAWLRLRATEFRAKGATWFRASTDKDETLLIEGWRGQPDHEGEPRFMYSAEGR